MALINTTTTGIQGSTFVADGTGDLTIQQNGQTINKIVNQPTFSAYRSGTQSITTATFTKVQINAEEWDTASCFDNTTNYRFTPNVAGYYQISGCLSTEDSGGAVTRMIAIIYKNGSEWKRGNDIRVDGYQPIVSCLVYMNGTTDYVELYAYLTGSSLALRGSQIYHTYFQGILMRAA